MKGTEHELDFWKEFVKTDRFITGWLANIITPELEENQPEVVQLIQDEYKKNPNLSILDCGSGVISILHGLVPDENIVATDLLANEYATFFDYSHLPHCKPSAQPTETLNKKECYDIVHMRNALDHTQDIKRSYNNLHKACKKGGYLIIHGFENEGTFENYEGLHQWNLKVDDRGRLWAKSKAGTIFNSRGKHWYNKTLIDGKKYFIWMLQK